MVRCGSCPRPGGDRARSPPRTKISSRSRVTSRLRYCRQVRQRRHQRAITGSGTRRRSPRRWCRRTRPRAVRRPGDDEVRGPAHRRAPAQLVHRRGQERILGHQELVGHPDRAAGRAARSPRRVPRGRPSSRPERRRSRSRSRARRRARGATEGRLRRASSSEGERGAHAEMQRKRGTGAHLPSGGAHRRFR